MITANTQLLKYIALHTGWNKSVESASDLADNILQMVFSFVNLQMRHTFFEYVFGTNYAFTKFIYSSVRSANCKKKTVLRNLIFENCHLDFGVFNKI